MADSVVLHDLTGEEKEKANHILEVAEEEFREINITVTDFDIVFEGNDFETLMKCKQWFACRIGRHRPNPRRRPRGHASDDEDTYATLKRHEYTKYITYEKVEVVVVEGDLLNFNGKIDCYVNTTNSKLDHQSQVSTMLKGAGGKLYENACERVRLEAAKLRTTQCVITDAGSLSTKHVIHAICPVQPDYVFTKKMENDIFLTVYNCLKMAEEHKLQTIAFSFLCTGNGQIDIKVCSQQYAFAVLEFSRLRKSQFVVDTVYFIDKDKTKVVLVKEVFSKILPSTEMQLLEVPKQDYSAYSMSVDTATARYHMEHVSLEASDEVGGQRASVYSRQSQNESFTLQDEEAVTADQSGNVPDQERCLDEDGYEISIYERTSYEYRSLESTNDSTESFQNEHIHVSEQVTMDNSQEKSEFRKQIGKYELVLERGDIRNSDTKAIVCPENEGEERGGLLAAAIKCTFRQSFEPKKLNKLQKNAIATTGYKTESGGTQFILHVQTNVLTKGCNENEFEKCLKVTMELIFDKLRRHKKRNIRSIAIPLIGINSVENDDVVGKCCKWQIEKILEILQRKQEITNLREVRLINRCEKIRNTLLIEMKAFLDGKMLSS